MRTNAFTGSILSHQSLLAILRTADPALTQARRLDDTDRSVSWRPVLAYSERPRRYGLIVETGEWATESTEGHITNGCCPLTFLVLLELPWREVIRLLLQSLADARLPAVVAQTFPTDRVLEYALQFSSYWAGLAHQWLSEGYPLNDRLAELAPHHPAVLARKRSRLHAIFGEHGPAS